MFLSDEDQAELDALNQRVTDALNARTLWLDGKMSKYAKVQVGEAIYDLETGQRLGVVSGLYRFHGRHNPLYDTELSISYEYETRPNSFDNTSRQPGLRVGNAEQAREAMLARARYIERSEAPNAD